MIKWTCNLGNLGRCLIAHFETLVLANLLFRQGHLFGTVRDIAICVNVIPGTMIIVDLKFEARGFHGDYEHSISNLLCFVFEKLKLSLKSIHVKKFYL